MRNKSLRYLLGFGLLLLFGLILLMGGNFLFRCEPLPSAQLADGRILRIERVTYGLEHRTGSKSVVEYFRPWLPGRLCDLLTPKYPANEITLERPGLVVWVNALDPITGKNVDCQGIRVEFVDKNGDLFGQATSSWYGSPTFSRVGHIFYAFPRAEQPLTLLVTCWRTNGTARFEFPNPQVTKPARWQGTDLPQKKQMRDWEIALTELLLRTNGAPKQYWETPCRYWKPVWELRQNGAVAAGWEEPEWIAEDPTGNRSQFLGVHQPVLRFSATFYPAATNIEATQLLAHFPLFELANLQSNIWWDKKIQYGRAEISVLGLFTNGTHVFSEGVYQTNPPVRMGPVQGGAPSGWVGQSQRLSPMRVKSWAGHYTPVPVIYLHAPELGDDQRLAVRLRDEKGRYWAAKPEPQGNSQGIKPFLLETPPEVKTVAAEVVVRRPVKVEFVVDVPEVSKRDARREQSP